MNIAPNTTTPITVQIQKINMCRSYTSCEMSVIPALLLNSSPHSGPAPPSNTVSAKAVRTKRFSFTSFPMIVVKTLALRFAVPAQTACETIASKSRSPERARLYSRDSNSQPNDWCFNVLGAHARGCQRVDCELTNRCQERPV